MALSTYLLLLHITGALSKDCIINNLPVTYAWEKQLLKDLKCDKEVAHPPPANKTSPLSVSLRFVMKSFLYDSTEEIFTINAWMFISWTDERLKWDREKYGGVNETVVSSPSIWMPVFRLFNTADGYDFDRFFYVHCNVKYTGWVMCVPRELHIVRCSASLYNWPYDRQKCSVIYGAWSPYHGQVKLSFKSKAISMLGAEYGAEWMIVDYEQKGDPDSDEQLTMTFVMDREAESLAAMVLYPLYILTALNIIVLWLDVRDCTTLYLASFSVLCHFYYLTDTGDKIPRASADPPMVLLYYRASLLIGVITFFLTLILAVVCKKSVKPYDVIVSANDFVYKTYGRFIMFPKWDPEKEVLTEDEPDFRGEWMKFANLINNLYAVIVILVYIILYCKFMPKPHPWIN